MVDRSTAITSPVHLPRASCSVREVPIHAAAVIPQSGTGCTPRLHSAPPQCAPQQQRPHASRACVRTPAGTCGSWQRCVCAGVCRVFGRSARMHCTVPAGLRARFFYKSF